MQIKTTLLAAALLVAGACGGSPASAADVYLGADVGYAFSQNSIHAFAPWKGYRVQSFHVGAETEHLGAEIGWQTDGRTSDGFGTSTQGPTLDAFLYLPVSSNFRLFATGGGGYLLESRRFKLVLPAVLPLTVPTVALTPLGKDEGLMWRGGLGAEWEVIPHLGLRGMLRYERDPNAFQQASDFRATLGFNVRI